MGLMKKASNFEIFTSSDPENADQISPIETSSMLNRNIFISTDQSFDEQNHLKLCKRNAEMFQHALDRFVDSFAQQKKKKRKKHFIASFGRVRETEVENQQLGEQFTIR